MAQLWYFHVGRVCNDIHYSKNSCSLHTTCRILFFHNHRLVKTNFHTWCKHVSEPETNSSLSHAIEPLEMLSYQRELKKKKPLAFPIPKAMKTLLRKSVSYTSGFSSHVFSGSMEYLLQNLYILSPSAVYLAIKNPRHCYTLGCSFYICNCPAWRTKHTHLI